MAPCSGSRFAVRGRWRGRSARPQKTAQRCESVLPAAGLDISLSKSLALRLLIALDGLLWVKTGEEASELRCSSAQLPFIGRTRTVERNEAKRSDALLDKSSVDLHITEN